MLGISLTEAFTNANTVAIIIPTLLKKRKQERT